MAAAQQSNLELHKQARLLNEQLLLSGRIETHARSVARHRLAARCYLNETQRNQGHAGPISRPQIMRTLRFFGPSFFREALLAEVRARDLLKFWPRRFRQPEVAR